MPASLDPHQFHLQGGPNPFFCGNQSPCQESKIPQEITKEIFEICWEYLSVLLFFLAECEALVHLKEGKTDRTKKGVSEEVHYRITEKRKWKRGKGRKKEKHL